MKPVADSTRSVETPRELRDGMARLSRQGTWLARRSLGEGTVIPIPHEAIVVPLTIGRPKRPPTIATAIWVGCIFGAALFHFIGLWLAGAAVLPALDAPGLHLDIPRPILIPVKMLALACGLLELL